MNNDPTKGQSSEDGSLDVSPAIKALNGAIDDAVDQGASHIHFQPLESGLRVSFRVDDVLREVAILPGMLTDVIVGRLKKIAKLDVSERRQPQNGRIVLRVKDGSTRRIMVCTLPTSRGERVVLAFDKPAVDRIAMNDLGFAPDVLERLKQTAQLTFGVVLIAGPQRSGRSTTLYSILDYMNDGNRCILTAEDPMAYALDGIGQVQVDASLGCDYAALIRAILRHDPDVIMVRDIRDRETADAVLQSAGTHPVFCSVEANGAPQALLALIRLGGSPQMVASAVRLVMAQRFVRRLCENCRADDPASNETLARLSSMGVSVPADAKLSKGSGCQACRQTGYRGRLPIGEILTPSEAVRAALLKEVSGPELRKVAAGDGMTTLAAQTLNAAVAGRTTIGEYWRMVAETEDVPGRPATTTRADSSGGRM
jgi:type II secretory ATPase GspE/PulE/Tfp pilus assembly ATPase PilB-like protein